MLICVCLRILASSRIPRYDLGDKPLIFEVVLSQFPLTWFLLPQQFFDEIRIGYRSITPQADRQLHISIDPSSQVRSHGVLYKAGSSGRVLPLALEAVAPIVQVVPPHRVYVEVWARPIACPVQAVVPALKPG
jgi:hypothetical protein